ncbi:FOG: Transposon-encoded proteins with TYA, reverse transcriptase, integrase domains in various combinations [Plasmopara halstedii]|uniref:FOG: Transposon-encoded proteins with TYA, reverse transcriptase, integrase domains in various combinations n=1 Tax=Plasmopara halstedii TaxID=4781 RepID=A0A0P1AVE1_PLAHL|nr:FOG: Transposon-encoded proteins with TYA, reverse transcriptase, integrase domains in various combinations [Plasmopara halstedii]CEG44454.1 FOG: Transposon-encoded proteins with TYA, reverse transcriptase, integrase domains in various combinations [Plasmopara halstedii]|eukprot:XP_024580823.1 FOG: Transposon-encoded proteins with TYA, reverse transcriptase, integrase domains in various combinations [Plasmopara halstedii]
MMRLDMRTNTNRNEQIALESYSDADFAADKRDRKSLTGAIVLLNGMFVSWAAKKQGDVSFSTMEAEFVAASETARELLGIEKMLKEEGLTSTQPMSMHVDNEATIRQIEGKTSFLKAKHIDVRLTFVIDFACRGVVEMRYVRFVLMLADLLAKALDQHNLAELRPLVGLR